MTKTDNQSVLKGKYGCSHSHSIKRKPLKLSGKMVTLHINADGETERVKDESETTELQYTPREKQAAMILDRLLNNEFIQTTGAFISPETYQALVFKLSELLP